MRMMNSIKRTAIVAAIVSTLAIVSFGPQKAAALTDPRDKRIFGTIVSVDLTTNVLTLLRRNGKTIVVDISQAAAADRLGVLPLNTGVVLHGFRGTDNVFHVQSIGHAAPRSVEWTGDTEP